MRLPCSRDVAWAVSALVGVSLLACSSPALAQDKTGAWELVNINLINKVMPQEGWTHRVITLESGKLAASAESADKRVYGEAEGTWTIPAARLIPGDDLTLTATIRRITKRNIGFGNASCWLWVTGIGMSGRFSTAELDNSAPEGASISDTRSVRIPEGSEPLGKQKGFITAKISANGDLAVEYEYVWNPAAPRVRVPGQVPRPSPPPTTPTTGDSNTNNTAWDVGHPVAWVFRPDGTVGAEGLWSGTWTRSGNAYTVTLAHQGARDNFTVEFAPDGRSFTAYKDGRVYRRGTRR